MPGPLGAGMALVSGAREVNGEEGRKAQCKSLGLAAPSGGDPRMPSNVQETGDLLRLGGVGDHPRKLGVTAGARNGSFAEAETDPQGSLCHLQPPPAGSGSPTIPPHDSRRGSGGRGGTWRHAPETPVRGGAQALARN